MGFFKSIKNEVIEAIKKIRYGPPNLAKRRERARNRRNKRIDK